jgi:hypothetical protein
LGRILGSSPLACLSLAVVLYFSPWFAGLVWVAKASEFLGNKFKERLVRKFVDDPDPSVAASAKDLLADHAAKEKLNSPQGQP